MQKNGLIGGSDEAFIYPGSKLALLGHFKDNHMMSAQAADIIEATCSENVLKLTFSHPRGPKFHYNLSSNETVGDMPLVPDPYEAMTIKLETSSVPNSGHGIFTKRDVKEDEILAFYNGFRFIGKLEQELHKKKCENETEGETEEIRSKKCAKYRISNYLGDLIDIPPYLDDINLYNATLAQKVNNKFKPFINAAFGNIEHPRFGAIVTVWAIKDIKAGEEIFLNYGYNAKAESTRELFSWYADQYEETQAYLAKIKNGEDVSHLPIP